MASHSQNIEALRTAVYGEQVRGAMIELFEEDYTMVNKGIGVGTDVTSSSSPVTGYVDGNVYINSETLDIWKTDGSVWDNKGNLKGIADIEVDESTEDAGENVVTITLTNGTSKTFSVLNGSKGSTGVSIVNAVDDGQGKFHLTKSDGTNTAQIQTVKGDKGDKGDKGEKGDDGERGRSVSSILMSGTGKSHPITATYSDGSSAVVGVVQDGADGQGTGDMTKATYDVNDNGYVDAAAALTDGTNVMPYSTVTNKADKSTTLSGYGITNAYTKTEVNTALTGKVSEPTSDGSDGQALMTDGQGGRTWGNPNYVKSVESTQLDVNASGKLSLASQLTTKLSHIEESDAWDSTKSNYKSGDVVIYNNAMYAVKDNISAVPVGTLPTNTTYYEPYSISALKSSLANSGSFKSGDTITFTNVFIGGLFSGQGTSATPNAGRVYFSLPTPKRVGNLTPTLVLTGLEVRTVPISNLGDITSSTTLAQLLTHFKKDARIVAGTFDSTKFTIVARPNSEYAVNFHLEASSTDSWVYVPPNNSVATLTLAGTITFS